MLQGGVGILIPTGKPEATRRAISSVRESPELRRSMIERGLQRIRQYDSAYIARRYIEELYRPVLERSQLPHRHPQRNRVRKIGRRILQVALRSSKMQEAVLRFLRVRRPYTILCYHQIQASSEYVAPYDPGLVISTERLEQQLRLLLTHYDIITVRELRQQLSRQPLPARPLLALTFDDGYESVFTQAAPVLEKFGLRATVFVNASVLGNRSILWPDAINLLVHHTPYHQLLDECQKILEGPQSNQVRYVLDASTSARDLIGYLKSLPASLVSLLVERLWERFGATIPEEARPRYLNADQIRLLHKKGFEIGGHTIHHPILTRASPEMIEREIGEDKRQLETIIGEPLTSFAYPNGDYNEAIQRVVAKQGYTCAVTTGAELRRRTSMDFFALDRYCISNLTAQDGQGIFGEARFFAELSGMLSALRGYVRK